METNRHHLEHETWRVLRRHKKEEKELFFGVSTDSMKNKTKIILSIFTFIGLTTTAQTITEGNHAPM